MKESGRGYPRAANISHSSCHRPHLTVRRGAGRGEESQLCMQPTTGNSSREANALTASPEAPNPALPHHVSPPPLHSADTLHHTETRQEDAPVQEKRGVVFKKGLGLTGTGIICLPNSVSLFLCSHAHSLRIHMCARASLFCLLPVCVCVCVCVCVKTGWRERYLVLQHNRNQYDLQYFEVGLLNTSQGPRICVCGCLLSCSALSSPLFACGSVRYVHNGKLREKERESAHTRAHASVCMRTSTHECAHVYKHVCTLYNCKYTREYGHWGHAHIGG